MHEWYVVHDSFEFSIRIIEKSQHLTWRDRQITCFFSRMIMIGFFSSKKSCYCWWKRCINNRM